MATVSNAAAADAPTASVNAEAAPAPSSPAAHAARHFDIMEYVVDGNTVLDVPVIEDAVYPFLGEGRTASDVDRAREALEQAYHAHGFQTVQVQIPQQGVENGIIHLQVVENPVGRLRVVDSHYHSLDEIEETAPSVAEGKVVNMNDLQNDIVALNQQPDLKVTPVLKAGEAPGTVDVDLQVKDQLPVHGRLEINNQYNQDTTPLRTVGTVSYDNLWQLGHSISLSYETAPEQPSDAKVLTGSYLARLPRSNLSLLVYGVRSDSNVAALAGTDVVGKGTILGARAIVTPSINATLYQSITAGIDRKNLSQNVITAGVPSNAPVLYYPVTLAYSAKLQNGDAETTADASLNFAMAGVGSIDAKFDAQRFDALRDYYYLRATVSHTQPLPLGWSLYGRGQGQITGDPLLPSEQLSAGGANSVRGYLEAERLGDYGVIGTVELRGPSFARRLSPSIDDLHPVAFVDGAELWDRQPLQGELSSFAMGSFGGGLRLAALDHLNAILDLAVPLVDGAVTKAGNLHAHFQVWSEF